MPQLSPPDSAARSSTGEHPLSAFTQIVGGKSPGAGQNNKVVATYIV